MNKIVRPFTIYRNRCRLQNEWLVDWILRRQTVISTLNVCIWRLEFSVESELAIIIIDSKITSTLSLFFSGISCTLREVPSKSVLSLRS